MTRRDCVKAAIRHETADRVPYVIDLCADAWEAIEPHAGGKSKEAFVDNDVLDVPVCWWNWQNLGPEWQGIDPPRSRPPVVGLGGYAQMTDRIKAVRDAGGDQYLLVRVYGSHFEKAYFARGIENFLADLAGEPEFAAGLLQTIIEKNLVMLENFLALPEIDGVLLGSDWGSQLDLLMAPQVWEDLIRPGEQKEYDLIHSYGKDVWIHSCGNIRKIIPSLIEMGVDVLNPVQPEAMDLAALKSDFGDKLTFWGGISTQQTLPYGTPDEVRQEARRVRQLMARGGGYIFSPAQHIQSDVPVANFLALLEVARER